MASRESQGLQIALIIFVMVTVVLAVLTFVFYRSAETNKKLVADEKQTSQSARDALSLENFKVQYFNHILGQVPLSEAEFTSVRESVVADENMQQIDELYDQHMKTAYGDPYKEKTYRDLLPDLLLEFRKLHKANVDYSDQVAQLNAANQKLQQDESQRTQQAVDNLQKARNDLSDRTQEFEKRRGDLTTQQQSQLSGFQKAINDEKAKALAALQSEKKKQEDMDKMQFTIDQQREALEQFGGEEFEVADGRILWVSQRNPPTAWINLGSADGLRRQTTFSVYGQDSSGVTDTESKASIEVKRVMDAHLAEARIVADNPADPILPGDQVFSPAWRPGRRIHFALAGMLDVDGDGRSDRDLVRNLISSNGAVIDAEVTETGESYGAVTAETRYLVRGETPSNLNDPKVRTAWNKIIEDAQQLGVETKNLEDLLSWMGYKSEVRTVPLGKAAKSRDFRGSPEQGKARTSTGNVSDVFESRTPAGGSSSDSPF